MSLLLQHTHQEKGARQICQSHLRDCNHVLQTMQTTQICESPSARPEKIEQKADQKKDRNRNVFNDTNFVGRLSMRNAFTAFKEEMETMNLL